MNTREVTRQYRLNQWTDIIRECRSSGQTVSAWCADYDINPKSYYYWLRCVRLAACKALPALDAENKQIVPVNVPALNTDADLSKSEAPSGITMRFDSITLEIHNHASAALIENTLRALQNVR